MKKWIIAMMVFCLAATAAQAQKLTEGSLDFLQDGTRIMTVIDYAEADIMGMDEAGFGEYEEDWFKDKPGIQSRLFRFANASLAGKCFLGNYRNAEYTLRLVVLTISDKGDWDCDAILTDAEGNVLAVISGITGPGGVIGTKLNLIKDGAKSTGVVLGTWLRKNR